MLYKYPYSDSRYFKGTGDSFSMYSVKWNHTSHTAGSIAGWGTSRFSIFHSSNVCSSQASDVNFTTLSSCIKFYWKFIQHHIMHSMLTTFPSTNYFKTPFLNPVYKSSASFTTCLRSGSRLCSLLFVALSHSKSLFKIKHIKAQCKEVKKTSLYL